MKGILLIGIAVLVSFIMNVLILKDWYVVVQENPTLFLISLSLFASPFLSGVAVACLGDRWMRCVCIVGSIVFSYLSIKYIDEADEIVYFKAAEQGDSKAQFRLANRYEKGEGVEKNDVEAVKWFRKAAEQGHSDAQFRLANRYEKGEGVEKNDAEAAKWFRKAAEQGEPYAQFRIGMSCLFGMGVKQSDEEALKWFGKIQEQNPIIQYAMGCNFLKLAQTKQLTRLKPELEKDAVKWFRKAAEQGEPNAQYALGMCYHYGDGTKQGESEALKWLQKAAKQGNEKAQEAIKEISK